MPPGAAVGNFVQVGGSEFDLAFLATFMAAIHGYVIGDMQIDR